MAPLKNGLMEMLKPPYPIKPSPAFSSHIPKKEEKGVTQTDRIVGQELFRLQGYPCASR